MTRVETSGLQRSEGLRTELRRLVTVERDLDGFVDEADAAANWRTPQKRESKKAGGPVSITAECLKQVRACVLPSRPRLAQATYDLPQRHLYSRISGTGEENWDDVRTHAGEFRKRGMTVEEVETGDAVEEGLGSSCQAGIGHAGRISQARDLKRQRRRQNRPHLTRPRAASMLAPCPNKATALLRPPSKRRLEDLVRQLQLTPHATAAALAGTLAAPSNSEAALAELRVSELKLLALDSTPASHAGPPHRPERRDDPPTAVLYPAFQPTMQLEASQIVRVRSRQYLVEEVVPPPEPKHDTLVRLSCLAEDAQGEVLWEQEDPNLFQAPYRADEGDPR